MKISFEGWSAFYTKKNKNPTDFLNDTVDLYVLCLHYNCRLLRSLSGFLCVSDLHVHFHFVFRGVLCFKPTKQLK